MSSVIQIELSVFENFLAEFQQMKEMIRVVVTDHKQREQNRFLSIQQVSEEFGISKPTVHNYLRKGVLVRRQMNGSRAVRLLRSEVEAAFKVNPRYTHAKSKQ